MSIIYKTTNLLNGKIYVGHHYTSANDGYYGSGIHIKRSINKYGKENFKRETLEFCMSANINEKEIYWISILSATNKNIGYNISTGGTGLGMLGKNHKEETLKKLSNFRKGKHLSETSKMKVSIANKGKKLSEEQKNNLRKIHTGKKLSEEHIRKMIKSRTGKKFSDERKKRQIKYIWNLTSPDGIEYKNIELINKFCQEQKLNSHGFYVASLRKSKYKGWQIEKKML